MDQSWNRLWIWRTHFFSHLSNSAVVKLSLTLLPNAVPTRAHSLMPGVMTVLMFFWCVDGVFFFNDGFSVAATVGGKGSCPLFFVTTVVVSMVEGATEEQRDHQPKGRQRLG